MWADEYDLHQAKRTLDLLHAAVREAQLAIARSERLVEESHTLVELATKLDTPILGL